ncbi:hypothetical protein ACFP1Z_33230 [Streptomyces gamaensis]|uniref:WXG100 family type VII secretion target n=1 Tax=Streptomyces gamaensis TaxID=1763542 RepID=A0ABW0Z854_9ACTN
MEQHVEPGSQAAGRLMDAAMESAAKGFADWATGAGLNEALEGWRTSVKALQSRLASEKSALSGTQSLLSGSDARIGASFPLGGGASASGDGRVATPSRVNDY